ncbi:MAG: aspartate aminotransferase family protein [Clostridium sp.]|nr:aspartate aminotransferase family protein [Clostridium sp.]MDY3828667.1 aspartate aminotransferase family protein [Clostridium sp.]
MENSLMNTYGATTVITKGNGCYLYDDNNKEYIDFTSGIGVNCLGYNDPDWTEAVTKQVTTLQHCSNLFLNPATVTLSNKLTQLAGMSKVFFANSGAEANEGAIKLARKYSSDKYGNNRGKVLTLKQSFHGRTMLTLKATGQPEKFHKYFFPFPEGFDYVEANNIEAFKSALTDDVCAIMMEAIQGEGGVHPLNKEFVQEVVKICNEKDILVIFDEVQCGIGRTGKLFGFNNFDIKPDIVSCAKGLGAGLPMGAVLCNEKLKDVFNPGDHGSTFGGNPVSCAGALVVLDKLCNENSYNEINKKGQLIKDLLNKANLSNVVEIRGMGLMLGIEIKENSADIRKKAEENGILVLTAGPKVIRLLPPLVISEDDIKKGINVLIDLLK